MELIQTVINVDLRWPYLRQVGRWAWVRFLFLYERAYSRLPEAKPVRDGRPPRLTISAVFLHALRAMFTENYGGKMFAVWWRVILPLNVAARHSVHRLLRRW